MTTAPVRSFPFKLVASYSTGETRTVGRYATKARANDLARAWAGVPGVYVDVIDERDPINPTAYRVTANDLRNTTNRRIIAHRPHLGAAKALADNTARHTDPNLTIVTVDQPDNDGETLHTGKVTTTVYPTNELNHGDNEPPTGTVILDKYGDEWTRHSDAWHAFETRPMPWEWVSKKCTPARIIRHPKP